MLKVRGALPSLAQGVLRSNTMNSEHLKIIFANWKTTSVRAASTRMTTKAFRVKKNKPPPYPYENGSVNTYTIMMDLTLARFDENSKLVIVEGPVNSGKNEVAKKIAEEFELKYMPSPTMDDLYINAYGYDLRNCDNAIPPSLQSFDEKKFNENPTHFAAGRLQLSLYEMRFLNYIDALAHILNTGQGVVMVRSPFSDFIHAEAMFQHGYISPQVKNHYYQVVKHSIMLIWRPHLIVYLDVPVEKTLENNKKRGTDYEANSKALTPEYLQTMETLYKDKYLPEAAVPGEIILADWSEHEDIDNIIEDIEAVDLTMENRGWRDPKFYDWRQDEWWYDHARYLYTSEDQKARLYQHMNVCTYDTPELFASDEEWKVRNNVYKRAPGMEYSAGFNIKRGEKGVMWRNLLERSNKFELDY